MGFYFNTKILFFIFGLICLTWLITSTDAISCDSCGRECASACGTKHFRTCCFNYLRKRSTSTSGATKSISAAAAAAAAAASPPSVAAVNSITDNHNNNNNNGKSTRRHGNKKDLITAATSNHHNRDINTSTHNIGTISSTDDGTTKSLTFSNNIEEFLDDLLHNTKNIAHILRQTIQSQKSNNDKRHEYLDVDYL